MEILKSYANTSGGQIHYSYKPGEGIPIVCFHQTASSGRSFYKLMKEKSIKNAIYALDTPGFGNSFDPEGMPDFEQYASWLLESLDNIGIKRFHALGHHTGAAICVEISKTNKDLIASMILIGPFPLTFSEREEFRPAFSTPISPNADGSYLIDTWNYLAKLGANKDLQNHHEEFIDHVRAYYSRYQTYSAVWDYDFTKPYQEVTCPILLMAAPDDVLEPYLKRSAELQPNAKIVKIKGANYEPYLDAQQLGLVIQKFFEVEVLN
jgi:pimeloyl-ACP methyl ester carboxylesterase